MFKLREKFACFIPPYTLTKERESTQRLYFLVHIKSSQGCITGHEKNKQTILRSQGSALLILQIR